MGRKAKARWDWDLTGGRLALDFVNTSRGESRRERLSSWEAYVDFARTAGALDEAGAKALLRAGAEKPADAERALAAAREARAALTRIFEPVSAGRAPRGADLEAFNAMLAEALTHQRVVPADGGFQWTWERGEDLAAPLWPILHSAAEILTCSECLRVRECGSDTCDWLFVDDTKNHSRKWCAMEPCGNRMKARRFYERHKQG
jgi:predicted RNA-binding Zn ribbon-like protein